ncbi:hypothetical protein B0H11DRAFT_2255137 [Mycena galericulata]|nr:hypothetical protein B0H11DRAFT_2255137 [Mycena galericulata]
MAVVLRIPVRAAFAAVRSRLEHAYAARGTDLPTYTGCAPTYRALYWRAAVASSAGVHEDWLSVLARRTSRWLSFLDNDLWHAGRVSSLRARISRDRSSASTALLGTARARRGCWYSWFILPTTPLALPLPGRIPLVRRSGYAVPYMLLLKFTPSGPTAEYSVLERMPTGGTLLWSLRGQAAQCMRLFADRRHVRARTLPVELLPGESTSNAYCISRHDPLMRRGPHALLPRLPEMVPICPAPAPGSPSGSPDLLPSWVRCSLPQGSPVLASSRTSSYARTAPAR